MSVIRKSADRLQTLMLGITLRDRIRNEKIRRRTGVSDLLGIVAGLEMIMGRSYSKTGL